MKEVKLGKDEYVIIMEAPHCEKKNRSVALAVSENQKLLFLQLKEGRVTQYSIAQSSKLYFFHRLFLSQSTLLDEYIELIRKEPTVEETMMIYKYDRLKKKETKKGGEV